MQEWLLYELIYVYYGMRRKLRGCPYGEHDELRMFKSAHYSAQMEWQRAKMGRLVVYNTYIP